MAEIMYLRPTGINQYIDQCSAQYYFQNIEKIKTPNKYHLAFGTSLHHAVAKNYKQKIETKVDLPSEEIEQEFSDAIDLEMSFVEKADFTEVKPGQLKDQGLALLKKYQAEVAPRVFPVAVEQTIRAKYAGYDYGLQGTLDLFDIYSIVTDHKTTAKEIKGNTVGYERQVGGFYPLLAEAAFRRPVRGSHIHYFRRDTGTVHVRQVKIDKDYALKTLQQVGDAITAGVFLTNRTSFLCTRRFCRFWNECEKKYGGSVKP